MDNKQGAFSAMKKLAGSVPSTTGSTLDPQKSAEILQKIFDFMEQMENEAGTQEGGNENPQEAMAEGEQQQGGF